MTQVTTESGSVYEFSDDLLHVRRTDAGAKYNPLPMDAAEGMVLRHVPEMKVGQHMWLDNICTTRIVKVVA